MPARRRAPQGCSLAKIRIPMLDFRSILGLGILQQNVKLFLREPLGLGSSHSAASKTGCGGTFHAGPAEPFRVAPP